MKEEFYKRNEKENKEELTLENSRALLNDSTISDERLENIINSIQLFCKISYELYSEDRHQKQETIENVNEEMITAKENKNAA
jgi:hypothetical protein